MGIAGLTGAPAPFGTVGIAGLTGAPAPFGTAGIAGFPPILLVELSKANCALSMAIPISPAEAFDKIVLINFSMPAISFGEMPDVETRS